MAVITEDFYCKVRWDADLKRVLIGTLERVKELEEIDRAYQLDLETYKPDLSHMSLGEIINWRERGRFVLFTRKKSNGKVQTVDQSDEISLYYKDNSVIDLNLEIEKRVK